MSYGLFRTCERRRIDIGPQVLGYALPDEEKRCDYRDRQQDVERAAGEIDPKIAKAARLTPGKAANQGNGQCDADGGRDEIMDREPTI